jgi:glycosyltransferase involved in cell wall biosynthesis
MRLLYLAPDFGWPAVRGGHVRVLSQLAVLASLPEVERIRVFWLSEERASFTARAGLAREMPKLEVLDPIFHPIHLFQHPRYVPRVAWLRIAHGVPYLSAKWESPLVRNALERELSGQRFDAVWLGALGTARYLPLVRRLQPHARVVLDQHNVESDIWAQFAKRQRGVRRAVAEAEWRRARRFEIDVLREVDAVGAMSADDARAYRDLAGVEARFVPQVVSFERRTETHALARACYVGTLTWHPNVRGLDWFCGEVWPHVRELLPTAMLEIAGSGLDVDARGAPVVPSAWRAPGITVLGFVPELAPLYERSALMVAPVLGGSGVRIKLLEAFRNGVPVVTTPDGARGLAIKPGREAFVESDARAFAVRFAKVAMSTDLQAKLRAAGYAYLEQNHGLDAAQRVVRSLLGSASQGADALLEAAG